VIAIHAMISEAKGAPGRECRSSCEESGTAGH
jgi:hypothetical protein